MFNYNFFKTFFSIFHFFYIRLNTAKPCNRHAMALIYIFLYINLTVDDIIFMISVHIAEKRF